MVKWQSKVIGRETQGGPAGFCNKSCVCKRLALAFFATCLTVSPNAENNASRKQNASQRL